jgi:hypothetical protein
MGFRFGLRINSVRSVQVAEKEDGQTFIHGLEKADLIGGR